MERDAQRLVVVSNRLPVSLVQEDSGKWTVMPGTGGLVTALSPVLRNRGGIWIGWLGNSTSNDLEDVMLEGSRESGYRLLPVELTPEEIEGYYLGFSNEVLWMLFHDFISLCNFEPAYWPVYQQANRRFAETIAQHTHGNDYIWVHDYHLLLVAAKLREMGVRRKVGFFLHTPFPPLDIFLKLPWRGDILEGMMQYDLLGFQTMRDMRNFIQCARALVPHARIALLESALTVRTLFTTMRALIPVGAREKVDSLVVLKTPHRELRVGAFPISIDFKDFMRRAATPEVSEEVERINSLLPQNRLVMGIDRLDYSK
jgi:trehalose 6-phosphate synthase/phosphatase